MTESKRKKMAQKNREKIIKMTQQLLLKKGSTGAASTTDICAAAKLTRPTLYHYFGSKRGLLLAVHMQLLDDFKPLIAQAGSIADPLERLVYMIRAYTRDICSHPELRVLIHDTLIINDRHFREVREVWKTHYILLRDTISQLKSEKRISQDIKSSWATLFILGMITWITYWYDFDKEESIDRIEEAAVKFVLQGLNSGNMEIPGLKK